MLIQRWQAPEFPTREQLMSLLEREAIEPSIETWSGHVEIKEHRHPWTEILVVTRGELVVDLGGHQVLLRQGDRIDIPAYTKHSYKILSSSGVELVMGLKI
ncbi:MAG: cupin domain-containing protein [Bdellovibrionaceae bacterium]|nr:cupin domain-containing protein [Pseudobdellovibrionaceae bacterium]MDW8189589.1 cupin domain-containing protein [Pseudobdellovibrionaceae bacterium]